MAPTPKLKATLATGQLALDGNRRSRAACTPVRLAYDLPNQGFWLLIIQSSGG